MNSFTSKLQCRECRTVFRVEMHKMRLNYPNVCPSCGSQCWVSGDQAIKAQRLLERLESKERVSRASPSLLFG